MHPPQNSPYPNFDQGASGGVPPPQYSETGAPYTMQPPMTSHQPMMTSPQMMPPAQGTVMHPITGNKTL